MFWKTFLGTQKTTKGKY